MDLINDSATSTASNDAPTQELETSLELVQQLEIELHRK